MNFSRRAAIPLVLAMVALTAAFASSASATTPAWIVEGKPLAAGATEAIAESTTVKETFSIEATGLNVRVACKGMSLPSSLIEGERTRKDNQIKMENCTLTGSANCTVPSTFSLVPMTSTLEGTAGSFKLKFAPSSGTTAMKFTISGAGCAIAGNFVIEGTMSCNYPGVETEAKNHLLEFSLTSGTELKRGSEKVTLTGKDEFWLTSNKNWKVA